MKKQTLFTVMVMLAILCAGTFYACKKSNMESGEGDARGKAGGTGPTLVSDDTYYTKITDADQAKMQVKKWSDGTYDVYVSNEPATENPVAAFLPDFAGTLDPDESAVSVPYDAGDYTYIKGIDPSNPIDCSAPTAGTWVYTCVCCGNGSGEGCKVAFTISPFSVYCTFDGGNLCSGVSAPAGSVACGMNVSGGINITGGGIMIPAAMTNIRIHQD